MPLQWRNSHSPEGPRVASQSIPPHPKNTNTLKFAELWESEENFYTYFEKRVERSGEDFGRLLAGQPEKECFQTDDWGYGKEWQK